MGDESQSGGAAAIAIGCLVIAIVVATLLFVGGGTLLYTQRQATRIAIASDEAARAAAAELRLAAQRQELSSQVPVAELSDTDESAIRQVLSRQQDAWNAGNIDKFMEHYWQSDELSFSAAGQVTRGWQATMDNYKTRYPTDDAMGKLSFGNLETMLLGPGAAMVLGEWQLDRDSDPIGGNFTLILKRIRGRWLIVHDHTSRRPTTSDE